MVRLFLIASSALWLMACNKEAQFIDTIRSGENPYLLQLDALAAEMVIFKADSVATSNDLYALIGQYFDTAVGKTQASHYIQFKLPESFPELHRTARFDSLVLILYTDSLMYGDSTSSFGLTAHRLVENIRSETNVFYNTSSFDYDTNPLAGYNGIFRPTSGDSVRLKLDASFGSSLFSLMQNGSDILKNQDKFEDWFKGICLTPSASTNVLYTFGKNISLRLYYSEDEAVRTTKTIDFSSSDAPYQFNSFQQDFSGTAFAALDNKQEIPVSATSNIGLLQSFSNIRTYLQFNGVRTVKQIGSYVQLLTAQLELKPVAGSYSGTTIPDEVNLYVRDVNNSISGPLSYGDGSTQTGNPIIDDEFSKETRYIFDITSYIQTEMEASNLTSRRLVVQLGGEQNKLKRLLLQPVNGVNQSSRLILSFLVHQQQN